MLATTIDNAITGDTTTIASKPATASPLKRSLGISAHEWQGSIHHEGRWFKDAQGRTLLLRGVNLSGSSKLPTSPYPGSTHLYDDKLFWDHRNVSFIGRPFPLEDARLHFARLRAWGLTLIRLLVPWESIEHKGPGEYDEEYIDYLRELIAMMPEYGLKCFIDPHQDTWSRFSGGSGAPGWTFEIAGMDIRNFKETGAAYVHNTNAVPGDQLPMVWPTNYTKLASCTMFTLFFGGDTFAPHHRYNGQSIQQFLSQSYINAFVHLAERLKDMEAVMGLEVMNEPHPGYIGLDNLDAFDPIVNLVFGDSPTPLQCFALGDGIPQTVDVYVKSWPIPTRKSHSRLMNESKTSAWLPGHSCIWKKHGVWKIDDRNGKPVLLDTKYFSKHPETGEPIEFYRDFYVPFVEKYVQAIKNVKADWYCLVEPLANEKAPVVTSEGKNIVYAPHWYDLYCLFYKKFDARVTHDVQLLQNGGNVVAATYFGRTGAKANYRRQIQNIKNSGLKNIGETPCIIGEVGIPMDLNEKRAFTTGDYKHHLHNMDAVMHALETNLVNFTLWNYDPCNDHEYGDHWNGENFSIYSSPQSKDKQSHADDDDDLASLETLPNEQAQELSIQELYKGGRVLAAVIRPYATKVSGTPLKSRFDLDSLTYYFAFRPSAVATTTEIFVPQFHYGDKKDDISVQVSHGKWQYIPERQTLYHEYISDPTIDTITIHIRSELPASSSSTCVIV